MSTTTTKHVEIEAVATFVPERSSETEPLYFFVYKIRITNHGIRDVQLIGRRWVITDADGNVQRVSGKGVIGAQPRLTPGESFDYTSFCPLPTPVGTMHGSFSMEFGNGECFEALISPFTLAVPGILN